MLDCAQVWQAVLGEIELLTSKPNFTTWFKGSVLASYDEQSAVVCVPNTFTKSWLETKFHPHIVRALQNITQTRIRQVVYRVEAVRVDDLPAHGSVLGARHALGASTMAGQDAASAAPREAAPVVNEFGLNQRYLFQSFVVGKGNELAHAACQAVATAVVENRTKPYNPLFLYGGVGLGKTHLVQAVGHAVARGLAQARIRYVTCEHFMNDFIHTVRGGQGKEFHDRYRNVDLLIIDDIQFIAGKEGTQEAFFHTFNHLHQNEKQVILTSDRPPKAIPALEARLLTRFEWGMIADVQSPDLETRIAILETKCRDRNFQIASEVLRFFATTVQNNVRELEGALNKFIAYVQFHKVPASVEVARQIIAQLSAIPRKSSLTPKQILQVVSEFFDVPIVDLIGKSRKKELVGPRQIVMFLMREEIKSSYPAIGNELGGRDHTTAMHAHGKITNEVESNEKVRQDVQLIRQRLYA
ncbi:chromosomal replication initiator protein DnaA [Candidatus Uhrbacteria bacterium]|nr:chromosomal replication initiator protein DnaA [Candidatus Uhrbacteria bacterium]